MKTLKNVLVILVLAAQLSAEAATEKTLADHISNKIQVANRAFQKVAVLMDQDQNQNIKASDIEFKQFFLGLAPTGSFGINSVVSLQVAPEITFVWEKTQTQ